MQHAQSFFRILIIASSSQERGLISRTLGRGGVSIQSYETPQQALLEMSEGKIPVPNVTFIDLFFPDGSDGYASIKALRAFHSSMVIIAMLERNPLRAYNVIQAGATTTVVKPVNPITLLRLANERFPR